jgi:hypothetical protein
LQKAQLQQQGRDWRQGLFAMLWLRVFPLLTAPFALYLLMALGGGDAVASGHAPLLQIHMATGSLLMLNGGDIVSVVTVLALALDFGATANSDATSIVRLCLDGGLAVLFVLLLLLVSKFATASFLLLTIAALLEFMVGAAIMAISARRDVSYDR